MNAHDARAEALEVKGLANAVTELDMIISPNGGHLVPVAMHYGVHVCWGCMEPFDPVDAKLRLVEMRPPGSHVPVGIHAKCINPAHRKVFSDMGGTRELQSVESVSKGLRIRRRVAQIVKATAHLASNAADKIIL